jgi:hypothetical protein
VELYKFFWGALAWIATIAVLWPINVPLLALAYKIQNGAKPLPIERAELWYRSAFGAGILALVTLGFVLLDYLIIDWADLPPGPIHLAAFVGYIPSAAYVLTIAFAYGELAEGLGIFVIYVGLPVMALFLINAVLGVWEWPLRFAHGYLKEPT